MDLAFENKERPAPNQIKNIYESDLDSEKINLEIKLNRELINYYNNL